MDTNIPAKQTFEQLVNDTVAKMTQSESGTWELPSDLDVSEEVKYTATLEKRRRDTQSEYTRTQQQLKAREAENEALAKSWEAEALKNISETKRAELDDLKFTDPDKWRTEMDKLETSAKTEFASKKTTVQESAVKQTELERREQLVKAHNEANPDFQLTDDVIANDIPPRFVSQLSKGEITFDEFIAKSATFLAGGKVVVAAKAPNEPDLSSVGGGATPSTSAVDKSAAGGYDKEIY